MALPARGASFWDGTTTHNPNAVLYQDKLLIYYMGTNGDIYPIARNRQRVGVAIADNPNGPWKRFDKPIIDISSDPNSFDSLCITNPAGTVRPDGKLLVIYKAAWMAKGKLMGGSVRYGVTLADQPKGPYVKTPGCIFDIPGDTKTWMLAEDPYIWFSERYGRKFYATARDVEDKFTQFSSGIVLFESKDGLDWEAAKHPLVLKSQFAWADGTMSDSKLERPLALVENGMPTMLFGAVDVNQPEKRVHSFNVHIPLKATDP